MAGRSTPASSEVSDLCHACSSLVGNLLDVIHPLFADNVSHFAEINCAVYLVS